MKPIFILCTDMHLRWTIPAHRKDDFFRAMWDKVLFISSLELKYKCPVLNAGDTFDTWRSDKDSKMIEWLHNASAMLPKQFITIYGQHEMPNHSSENLKRSPLELLNRMGRITIIPNGLFVTINGWDIYGKGYGCKEKIKGHSKSILLTHQMVWANEAPFPGAPPEGNALRVLEDNPGHKLIFCGDNHTPFFFPYKKRLLINGGSMMRTSVSQKNYEPKVWLFCEDGSFFTIPYPIQEDVWEDKNVSVGIVGKEYEVVRIIKDVNGVEHGFEYHVRKGLKSQPHQVKVKVNSIMKGTGNGN